MFIEDKRTLMYKLLRWMLFNRFVYKICLKETRNSFKKWPLNLWRISNKTVVEVGIITKAAVNWSTNIKFSNKLFHFFMKLWMLQLRKSRFYGISAISFQCCLMDEIQVLMTVSDFSGFFSRNYLILFLIGIHSMQGWKAIQGMALQEKETQKH